MRPNLAPESASERRPSADPLASPRPAGPPPSRARKPGARAAESEAVPAASGPIAPARPESSARPAAPEPAPAGSPSASASAATTDGSVAGPADGETSGRAVTGADQPVPAVTGGPPASSGTGSAAAAGATESGATESGAAESAIPSDGAPGPQAAAAGGAASEGVHDSTQAVVQVLVVPGIARFHQTDCILIRFLGEDDLQRMSREEAVAAGCAACRACRP